MLLFSCCLRKIGQQNRTIILKNVIYLLRSNPPMAVRDNGEIRYIPMGYHSHMYECLRSGFRYLAVYGHAVSRPVMDVRIHNEMNCL